MKYSKGERGLHRDINKGGNFGKIKDMVPSHYFIVHQVELLSVSDHCVKKTKRMLCPHEYIYILKSYILDYISCNGFVRVMG